MEKDEGSIEITLYLSTTKWWDGSRVHCVPTTTHSFCVLEALPQPESAVAREFAKDSTISC
jgi:hypothetical protein